MNHLVQNLRQNLKGSVHVSEDDKEVYAYNFGRMKCKKPQIIAHAICEQDVIHTFRLCQEAGVPISIRGAGHSCDNHSLADGGVLLVNFYDNEGQFKMLDESRVEVSTRTTWFCLEEYLNRNGRATPVLPDYLNLTVGGTLSVGGYGRRSIIHGAQVDHVESLQLILPNGETVFCSPEVNENLFRSSLTGLGQVGFIEKVILRTIPFKKVTKQLVYSHKSIDALVESLAWVVTPEHSFSGQFNASYGVQENFTIFGLEYETQDEALFRPVPLPLRQMKPKKSGVINRSTFSSHRYIENLLRGIPNFYNLWVDFFLDYTNLQSFMQTVNACLENENFSPFVTRANILAIKNPPHSSCGVFRPRSTNAPGLFSVGLYPSVPPQDIDGLRQVQYFLRKLLSKCLELNGLPYLYGWYDFDSNWKKAIYGDDYDYLEKLIAQLDSQQIFNRTIFKIEGS